MNSSTFFGITTFMYLFTMVLYFYYLFFRNKKLGITIKVTTIIGLLAHTAGLALRWIESYQLGYGHIPLSNMYETLISMSWCTVLVLLVMERKFKSDRFSCIMQLILYIWLQFATKLTNIYQKNQQIRIQLFQKKIKT